jgi:hypothetical protein
MDYIVLISMALAALIGTQTGMISGITNDIIVNQFARLSSNSNEPQDCGSYATDKLPESCHTGYTKTFTALSYGSLLREVSSIIGGLLTSHLTNKFSSHMLIATSITVTMIAPTTLLWIIHNENVTPYYIFILANSMVGLIKAFLIMFATLSKIESDTNRTNASSGRSHPMKPAPS